MLKEIAASSPGSVERRGFRTFLRYSLSILQVAYLLGSAYDSHPDGDEPFTAMVPYHCNLLSVPAVTMKDVWGEGKRFFSSLPPLGVDRHGPVYTRRESASPNEGSNFGREGRCVNERKVSSGFRRAFAKLRLEGLSILSAGKLSAYKQYLEDVFSMTWKGWRNLYLGMSNSRSLHLIVQYLYLSYYHF